MFCGIGEPKGLNPLIFQVSGHQFQILSDFFLNISFSGDIQDPPGQGPVQPAVGDPASAGGLD